MIYHRRGMGPRPRWKMLLGVVVPLIVFGIAWYFMTDSSRKRDALIDRGVHVPGKLIAVEETGTMVNHSPQLLLTMAFTRKNGRLDTAQTKFVPKLRRQQYFQVGTEVIVAYDTAAPDNVTFVDFATEPSASNNMTVDSLRHVADSLKKELDKGK